MLSVGGAITKKKWCDAFRVGDMGDDQWGLRPQGSGILLDGVSWFVRQGHGSRLERLLSASTLVIGASADNKKRKSMPTFEYQGVNTAGERVSGTVLGGSMEQVLATLSRTGLTIERINQSTAVIEEPLGDPQRTEYPRTEF